MKKVKAIQVGLGGFGRSWLELLHEHQDIEVVGVVDQQLESLTEIQSYQTFTSFEEALIEVEADFVLIVTPPKSHKALAERALKAGLHVMMEKPLTDTEEEAEELLRFSQSFDQHVMVSQNYRWNPQIQTVKQLISTGELGFIEYIDYDFNKATHFGGWRDEYEEILLQDMAIHHFDLLRYLLDDEAKSVQATSFKPSWSWFKGNPHADVAIHFKKGTRVQYRGRWAGYGKKTTWNGTIRFVGEKGAVELVDDRVFFYRGESDESVEMPLVTLSDSDRMISLNTFIQSIKHNTIPPTSIEDNIKSLQLTWAAIESSQTGACIYL